VGCEWRPKEKTMNNARAPMVLGLVTVFALCACDKSGEDVQKKRDEAQQQLTQAQLEANRKVDQAQIDRDQKVQKADADFQKSVVDYRTSREKDLADIDKNIDDLSMKDKTATGQKKAKLDGALPEIRTDRANLGQMMRSIDSTTPTTFDATKANLDKAFDELKDDIKKAQ